MKCKLIVYPSLNPELNMTLIYIISSLCMCLTLIHEMVIHNISLLDAFAFRNIQ